MPVGPRLWPGFSIGMNSPFYLNVGLVSKAEFGRHELANKPPAVAYLIGDGVAKIESPADAHIWLLRRCHSHEWISYNEGAATPARMATSSRSLYRTVAVADW